MALRSIFGGPNISWLRKFVIKKLQKLPNASLTGHMVFSTLHTNDAVSAVSRLVDIGIKPFLVSAVRSVLAQRLVRRICPKCKTYRTQSAPAQFIGDSPRSDIRHEFHDWGGLDHCNNTGFRGRVGIFEMFNVNEELNK